MGDVVNDAPLTGVAIVALVVGGGCSLVASRPYEPGAGGGLGSGVIAEAEGAITATIKIGATTKLAAAPTRICLIRCNTRNIAYAYSTL